MTRSTGSANRPNSYPALALLLALPIALAACSGKDARIQSHLDKGQSLLDQSDYDKAILEVRNVLQMDPKRASAYYLDGQIEEARGDLQKSFAAYSKAIELKPDLIDARTGIARLELRAGELDKAQPGVDSVLAQDANNAQALIVQAGIYARANESAKALAALARVDAQAHLPTSSSLLLAQLDAGLKKDPLAAQKVVDDALKSEPRHLPLLLLGANLAIEQGHSDAVVAYFKRATEAAPKNSAVWRSWAEFYDHAGKLDDAEKTLRASIAAQPDDSQRYLTLVSFLNDRRSPEAASAELVALSSARPHDYAIQFALAGRERNSGKIDDARALLERIAKTDPTGESGLTARNDLATLDLQGGDEQHARQRLDEILAINPRNSAALVSRAKLELNHTQWDAAIADLRGAAKEQPDSAPVLALLALAYRSNKQPDLARDTLADAAKLFPNRPELGLLLSEYYSRSGDPVRAIATLDDMIRANPRYVRAYEIKSALLGAAKDSAGAEATLRALGEQYPNDPTGPMHLGQLYESEQKYDLALAQYDRAQTLSPGANGPRVASIAVLLKANRAPEAARRVDTALQAAPDDALELGLRGDVKTASADYAGAETAYRRALVLQPKAIPLYLRLADMYAKKKDVPAALRTLDEGIAANPTDEKLLSYEAQYFSQNGRIDDAIARYDSLLQRNPANTGAANNLAVLLTDAKGDKASLDRALVLAERFQYSGEPGLLDTLGWTHYKLGQNEDAVAVLKRAEQLAPKSPGIELHYGLALYKAGDASGAREHLRIATESKQVLPDLDEARKIVAQG